METLLKSETRKIAHEFSYMRANRTAAAAQEEAHFVSIISILLTLKLKSFEARKKPARGAFAV